MGFYHMGFITWVSTYLLTRLCVATPLSIICMEVLTSIMSRMIVFDKEREINMDMGRLKNMPE